MHHQYKSSFVSSPWERITTTKGEVEGASELKVSSNEIVGWREIVEGIQSSGEFAAGSLDSDGKFHPGFVVVVAESDEEKYRPRQTLKKVRYQEIILIGSTFYNIG